MPRKPETALSEKVLSRLRAEGGRWTKVHGGPFQEAGVSDILGCWRGRFVAIELKIPGEKPTKLQETYLDDIHYSGGIAGVATTVQEAIDIRDGVKPYVPFKENRG